ncbi:MAG: hypothetical protein R3F21_10140 [Myxococcota bacterium]
MTAIAAADLEACPAKSPGIRPAADRRESLARDPACDPSGSAPATGAIAIYHSLRGLRREATRPIRGSGDPPAPARAVAAGTNERETRALAGGNPIEIE